MIYIPSMVLAIAVSIATSGFIHRVFGTILGSLIDLIVFVFVFYYTNRTLRRLRDG